MQRRNEKTRTASRVSVIWFNICIPNWNIGSELAGLDDTFWNSERLSNYTKLDELNSYIIATALAELSSVI